MVATNENKKPIKTVETLADYIAWITEINGNNPHKFLFRGLSSEKWDAEASAIRRAPKYEKNNLIWLREYNEDLIGEARARDYHHKDGKEHKEDLPLLAELQHHGAATALIDFSENPLVALYFACQATKEIKTGKVIAVTDNDELPNAQSYLDKNNTQSLPDKNDTQLKNNNDIEHFLNSTSLWQWRPPNNNNRILAQQSVFLFGAPVIEGDKEIEIANKEKLLKELKNYGIDEEKLFPDFYGFANINAHHKPYDNIDYFAKGIDAIQNQNYSKAIEYFNKAIAVNPKHAEAYHNRGVAKGRLGEHSEAIKDFNQTIKINPKLAEAYNNRGKAKGELKKYPEAIEDFNKALEINPNYDGIYYNRGLAQYSLGNYTEAIEDFNQALIINPDFSEAYNNRGAAKANLGKHTEAVEDFNKALANNPNNAQAYNNCGLAKDSLGEHVEAIKNYDKALIINPKLADAYVNRGIAKDNLGKHVEAIEDFNQALIINPKHANAYYNRGLAQNKLGNDAEAKKDFALAKKLLAEQEKNKPL